MASLKHANITAAHEVFNISFFTDAEEKMPLAAQRKKPRQAHDGKDTFLDKIDECYFFGEGGAVWS